MGLYVKEEGVKVVFISDQPMLVEMSELNFSWEAEASLSKLLSRFYVGKDISVDSMTEYLMEVLEDRIKKSKQNPQSLMVRVKIANQLITCMYSLVHAHVVDWGDGSVGSLG